MLISRSYSGGMPNGPSGAGDISHDDRRGRIAVFQSDASDIVRHDPNGHTDVFLVHRRKPYGNLGTLWHAGSNRLVSRGLGGAPANGRSYAPVVDGSTKHRPRCIAFISEASNLVRGDTNGVADAFVYSLHTHLIRRAFTSSATNLALTRTRKRAWKRGVSAPVAPGHRQVYVRFLSRGGLDRGFRGMTALASVSDSRQPANADSFGPAFARSGKALGFTSLATNLAAGDLTPAPDVYVRQMPRKFVHLGYGRGVQTLATHTRLVSDGGGVSSNPSLSSSGRYVAYSTGASLPQVVRGDLASAAAATPTLVSKTQTDTGDGPSARPSISDAGHFIAFESAATNLRMFPRFASDPNGVTDVYLGVIGYGSSSAESLESDNRFASAPSAAPRISARGNYIVFQSADQRMDARIPNPGMQQVYLRWLLPKVA
jgi:TolB protein